jgi:hypothetical protein
MPLPETRKRDGPFDPPRLTDFVGLPSPNLDRSHFSYFV